MLRRPHVVQTSSRNSKSRRERLSPSKAHRFTTKSSMQARPAPSPHENSLGRQFRRNPVECAIVCIITCSYVCIDLCKHSNMEKYKHASRCDPVLYLSLQPQVVCLYRAGNSVACKTDIMPPFHHHVRGLCHGITPVFLPAGAVGSTLALLHVAL